MSKEVTEKAIDEIRRTLADKTQELIHEYADEIKDPDEQHEYFMSMLSGVEESISKEGLI